MSLTKVLFASASITVCAASLPCYATVVPSSSVKLSIPSKYSFHAMIATFTPPGGLTLSAYATQLGYVGFDWQQTITNWPNQDLRLHNLTYITPVPPDAPIVDPPLTGYNYNPCGGTPSGSSALANPFYFTPTGSTDCWSLVNNETPTTNPTTLSFGDEPMDHLLTSAQIAANNVPKFKTSLVGIEQTDEESLVASSPLFFWTWDTTYTGSAGGVNCATTNGDICSRSGNSPDLQPGVGGTGRVAITSINGVPCHMPPGEAQPGCEGHGGDPPAAVPEPPGSLLLASGMLAALAARKMTRSKKVQPHLV